MMDKAEIVTKLQSTPTIHQTWTVQNADLFLNQPLSQISNVFQFTETPFHLRLRRLSSHLPQIRMQLDQNEDPAESSNVWTQLSVQLTFSSTEDWGHTSEFTFNSMQFEAETQKWCLSDKFWLPRQLPIINGMEMSVKLRCEQIVKVNLHRESCLSLYSCHIQMPGHQRTSTPLYPDNITVGPASEDPAVPRHLIQEDNMRQIEESLQSNVGDDSQESYTSFSRYRSSSAPCRYSPVPTSYVFSETDDETEDPAVPRHSFEDTTDEDMMIVKEQGNLTFSLPSTDDEEWNQVEMSDVIEYDSEESNEMDEVMTAVEYTLDNDSDLETCLSRNTDVDELDIEEEDSEMKAFLEELSKQFEKAKNFIGNMLYGGDDVETAVDGDEELETCWSGDEEETEETQTSSDSDSNDASVSDEESGESSSATCTCSYCSHCTDCSRCGEESSEEEISLPEEIEDKVFEEEEEAPLVKEDKFEEDSEKLRDLAGKMAAMELEQKALLKEGRHFDVIMLKQKMHPVMKALNEEKIALKEKAKLFSQLKKDHAELKAHYQEFILEEKYYEAYQISTEMSHYEKEFKFVFGRPISA